MKKVLLGVVGLLAALVVVDRALAAGGKTPLFQIFFNAGTANAIDRTAYDKLKDIISVKDYGAKGTGVDNDEVAVQQAITNAGGVGSNQLIQFPCPGSYKTTSYGTLACGIYYPPAVVTAKPRAVPDKLFDIISAKDFGAVGDGITDDTVAVTAAQAAVGNNGIVIEPGSFFRTDGFVNNSAVLVRRTDTFGPLAGAGILNPYLAPMMRLEYFAQGGTVLGSGGGILFYAPGIKGKTTTTLTAGITANAAPQTVAVADSSVVIANEVIDIDLNQGSSKSESVTITSVPDSTHIVGIFTKNHSNGAILFVVGKGDKIGYGCAMADAAANTNSVFCENLNVTAVGNPITVTGSEIDVTNSTGSAPGAYPGSGSPNLTGLAFLAAGANDSTNAIGISTASGGIGWLNGIQIEAAKNNGITIGNGGGYNVATGIAIQAAGTNGLVIGSNQTAASNPNFTLADPTNGIVLTSRGTSGSVASNTIRWQELVASASHTWDCQASSSQWKWIYDGTWQGAAVNTDGSIQTQKTFQLRNSSNSTIGSWDNQAGTGVLTTNIWVSAYANPASTGAHRWVNTEDLYFRNSTNSGDVLGLTKDSTEHVKIGDVKGVLIGNGGATLTNLGTPSDGTIAYCTDCLKGSDPCTATSTGTFALRINGAWKCL